jgi:VWFA-related protein
MLEESFTPDEKAMGRERQAMKIVRVLMLDIIVCLVSAAWGQAPVPPASGSTSDRPVRLDVVVTDKSGSPVPGLQQSDFTVLDDKQPQAILSFHAFEGSSKEAPLQVILLIDAVNASSRAVSKARQQLERFLRQGDGKLPVPMSLLLFTGKSIRAQGGVTRDRNALLDSVHSADIGLRDMGRSGGIWGAAEQMQLSFRNLEDFMSFEAKQPGRKLLIWLSSGWSLLSGPNVQLSWKDQEMDFQGIVKLSTQMREARVTLYSVDPLGTDDAGGFQTFYYENFLKGVVSPSKIENGDLGLQVIAAQSGGLVLNRNNDIASLIASCVADANAYYTLSFEAADADHQDEYHNLQIKIDKPGLTARTRTGYYAQRREVAK